MQQSPTTTENQAERRAVEDAFAESAVWGFRAEAETDGRVLVYVTDFVVRDAHGVARRLKETGQGRFQLDCLAERVLPGAAVSEPVEPITRRPTHLKLSSLARAPACV